MTVVLMLLALLASACTAPADQISVGASSPPAPEPSAGPGDSASGVPRDPVDECGDDLDAIDAVITEQLTAFADDDWDRALSLTSRQFRASGVDAEGLREIVVGGYAPAAAAEDHEVLGCVSDGSDAQVLITVTATDGATIDLVYLMTRQRQNWRISGAVDHGAPATEPPTIET